MAQPQKPGAPKRNDPKATLSLLKWTTTLSAVSLTLAGWGLLARAEAVNAASVTQAPAVNLTLGSAASAKTPSLDTSRAAAGILAASKQAAGASAGARLALRPAAPAKAAATAAPTSTAAPTAQAAAIATATDSPATQGDTRPATPTGAPTATPTDAPTPAPTDTPAVKFKLDVVQWVQNQAGDNIAVVRDNQGILWYVWGDDVPRIEQGLSPKYQPVPVNQVGRSRHS